MTIGKKESLLLVVSIFSTVLIAVGLIRWLAPGLLGGPTDLQLVQLDEKVPPFYKGVFRDEHFKFSDFQLKDPLTRVRNHPFFPRQAGLGPHDILGFRNSEVPVVADVITIGDSITYGNNVHLEQNWPSQLHANINREDVNVYNMSTGGWAAVQYLSMFRNASLFFPRVIVVAFYTGNDPLESFSMVYGNKHWEWLIPDDDLSKSDSPAVTFPAPESERWAVVFNDGIKTVFTPTLRLASNQDHKAVRAGYKIMASVATLIGKSARDAGIQTVFTIIPTKELVYARKIEQDGFVAPEDYKTLIKLEGRNIESLVDVISSIPGSTYIDILTPLQVAALDTNNLYTVTADGHPSIAGYRVIGETLANHVSDLIPDPVTGLYALMNGDSYQILLVKNDGVWNFTSEEMIEKNGWLPGELPSIKSRDVVKLPHHGEVTVVDRERFGPACCEAGR